jgi:hypothetical protein
MDVIDCSAVSKRPVPTWDVRGPILIALTLGVAFGAWSCGGGSASSPSGPPITIPSPTPNPTDGGGGPVTSSCPIGPGSTATTCGRGTPRILADVEDAMNALIERKPEIFDLQSEVAPGSRAYLVRDREAYLDGLVDNLRRAGLCAERDVDNLLQDTIRVKSSNDFSEDFDVLLGNGFMRRGNGAYRQTCNPAAFPVDRGPEAPPVGSGCGRPYPPPVTRFNCKVHLKGKEYDTLDSTPMVGPDVAYCTAIGFTDGRSICPVRPEGWPDRAACENWRVGAAADTGRTGPTWRRSDGSFCTGSESGCANHPENQYQLFAYVSGSYTVRAENGASCTVDVKR